MDFVGFGTPVPEGGRYSVQDTLVICCKHCGHRFYVDADKFFQLRCPQCRDMIPASWEFMTPYQEFQLLNRMAKEMEDELDGRAGEAGQEEAT